MSGVIERSRIECDLEMRRAILKHSLSADQQASCIIGPIACPSDSGACEDQAIPTIGSAPAYHYHIVADEGAPVGVEPCLVAVEGDGLKIGQTTDFHRDLAHWSTALLFGVATKYVARGSRNVSHESLH